MSKPLWRPQSPNYIGQVHRYYFICKIVALGVIVTVLSTAVVSIYSYVTGRRAEQERARQERGKQLEAERKERARVQRLVLGRMRAENERLATAKIRARQQAMIERHRLVMEIQKSRQERLRSTKEAKRKKDAKKRLVEKHRKELVERHRREAEQERLAERKKRIDGAVEQYGRAKLDYQKLELARKEAIRNGPRAKLDAAMRYSVKARHRMDAARAALRELGAEDLIAKVRRSTAPLHRFKLKDGTVTEALRFMESNGLVVMTTRDGKMLSIKKSSIASMETVMPKDGTLSRKRTFDTLKIEEHAGEGISTNR